MKPRPLPPEFATEPFAVRSARQAGVTGRRLRASDLTIPFRGVRTRFVGEAVEERCRAYFPRMSDGQFFSHTTAAALLQIPLPRRVELDARIHVSGHGSRPRAVGVVGHRALETPQVLWRGLPVTDPLHLLPEVAFLLGHDELVVAADGLIRRKFPLVRLADLLATSEKLGGRGIRAVRAALAEARAGTDSPMETRLRLLIVRAGLPEPVIHHTIYDAAGDFVGTPDLAYVRERIAIEYEGAHHREDPKIFADDIERRERMQEAGWYVIRVILDHVFREPGSLATRIRRVLAQRSV